ncbi:hypothetical protein G7070_14920 [Propioniciclava coleopterorum]|uniref:PNPLA domain-containing protein n=1 Tax=Propioniciclava coleopterorum TaxID=2714937 RepID=A0A6G7Y9G0_9ACTN|nr:patatin-like phospholipase family protein [Propioniciclava coleopterorum]QIK73316.1 hypothetical protein G7070_14920 [Propioniciclava coleopterorum]
MTEPLPTRSCDVIMKGGITSGVVYPRALARFARDYRLRRLGGASAGAIGAALGAAAEHGRGRDGGGFEALEAIPEQLGEGRLAALFQAGPRTRPLLGLMLAATGHDAPGAASSGLGRARGVAAALLRGWPVAALLGALPGLAGLALAVVVGGWAGVGVGALALVVLLVGVAVGAGVGVARTLTRDVPAQGFGICTGLGEPGGGPGFTEWLAHTINALAGRPDEAPLLYGHLWTGGEEVADVAEDARAVDLRMVSTCLTQARPYEMPWAARTFFYEPREWARLFPAEVMAALEAAPRGRDLDVDASWEDEAAAALPRPLRRLPDPEQLPVVVSVRMSLSFPLLISAVPLWTVDRRSDQTRAAVRARRAGRDDGPAPQFQKVWFTDGGFCSNFPVHLFDDALATRPTFAINLGSFLPGRVPQDDEARNIEWSRTNAAVLPSHRDVPERGWGAVTGFFGAALATSREWTDATQLSAPGMRDRVVRVLQSDTEGGLNLFMDGPTIERLAARGEAAAAALTGRFTGEDGRGVTGWDNHRWVRYRALMAALPTWLRAYAEGRAAMADLDAADPPSYPMSVRARDVAADLDAALRGAAARVDDSGSSAGVGDLTSAPRPLTVLRRTPQL